MTDNEVIKELQSASEWFTEHGRNTNTAIIGICDRAIELINRQKAEIERLEREIENLESVQEISPEAKHFVDTKADKVISLMNELIKSQEQIKAEAVKEFAERLKSEMRNCARIDFNGTYYAIGYRLIDNLVKEFTEGESHEMA